MSNDVDPQLDRLAPATRRKCMCMWDVHHVNNYGNMGVCCVCVHVCICEHVLTIAFLRVDEHNKKVNRAYTHSQIF